MLPRPNLSPAKPICSAPQVARNDSRPPPAPRRLRRRLLLRPRTRSPPLLRRRFFFLRLLLLLLTLFLFFVFGLRLGFRDGSSFPFAFALRRSRPLRRCGRLLRRRSTSLLRPLLLFLFFLLFDRRRRSLALRRFRLRLGLGFERLGFGDGRFVDWGAAGLDEEEFGGPFGFVLDRVEVSYATSNVSFERGGQGRRGVDGPRGMRNMPFGATTKAVRWTVTLTAPSRT